MTDKTYCLPDGTVLTMPATAAQLLREFSAEVDRLRQQVADLHTAARQNADLRRELTQLEVSADKALADAGDEILALRVENARLRTALRIAGEKE